jgi:hypothetical protein
LNPRPPGYEPGELPDCSTPRRGADCSTLVTVVPMWDWSIWGALILTALAGIAALVLLAARTRRAWHDVKNVRRDLVGPLEEFTAKAEATAERLSTAGDTAELQASVARLRVSLARLEVLTAALDEAQVPFGRVAAFLPFK